MVHLHKKVNNRMLSSRASSSTFHRKKLAKVVGVTSGEGLPCYVYFILKQYFFLDIRNTETRLMHATEKLHAVYKVTTISRCVKIINRN